MRDAHGLSHGAVGHPRRSSRGGKRKAAQSSNQRLSRAELASILRFGAADVFEDSAAQQQQSSAEGAGADAEDPVTRLDIDAVLADAERENAAIKARAAAQVLIAHTHTLRLVCTHRLTTPELTHRF